MSNGAPPIEPQSKSEAAVLKRLRQSNHWLCRRVLPWLLVLLPAIWILGGLALIRASGLSNMPDISNPERRDAYGPGYWLIVIGVLFAIQALQIALIMRERRTIYRMIERLRHVGGADKNS